MEVERAIAYVLSQANAVERARLAAVFWDEPPPPATLRALAGLQKSDGGFAYWVPEVSNVCDTAFVLQWFDDLQVYRGPSVDAACRFLLDRQQGDGGWNEVDAMRAWDPPSWLIPGRVETRTWLTAFCAHVLIRFSYAEAEGTRCPSAFLLAHRDQGGRLAGYLRATWLALPMLAFHPGRGSRPFQQALAVVEASYSPVWAGAYLAWLLRCLQDAGLGADHPLVARSLDDLERAQRSDGSWQPEPGEGEEHAVNATIAALRELKRYGRI